MAYISSSRIGVHGPCEQLAFVRTEHRGIVWYRFEADGVEVCDIFSAELPPIVIVRSSPIEGEST